MKPIWRRVCAVLLWIAILNLAVQARRFYPHRLTVTGDASGPDLLQVGALVVLGALVNWAHFWLRARKDTASLRSGTMLVGAFDLCAIAAVATDLIGGSAGAPLATAAALAASALGLGFAGHLLLTGGEPEPDRAAGS